jgi:hypothetical protein
MIVCDPIIALFDRSSPREKELAFFLETGCEVVLWPYDRTPGTAKAALLQGGANQPAVGHAAAPDSLSMNRERLPSSSPPPRWFGGARVEAPAEGGGKLDNGQNFNLRGGGDSGEVQHEEYFQTIYCGLKRAKIKRLCVCFPLFSRSQVFGHGPCDFEGDEVSSLSSSNASSNVQSPRAFKSLSRSA